MKSVSLYLMFYIALSVAHEKLTLATRVFESLFQKTFLLVQHITIANNLCKETWRLPV